MPIRVLVDANSFISYLLAPDSAGAVAGTVESFQRADILLVFPDSLDGEIRTTIARKPYLRERIAPEDIDELIAALRLIALLSDLTPIEIVPVLRDRKDDNPLAQAVRANVDILVSGDRDLLDIRNEVDRPRIMTPAGFVLAIAHR